jgi:hypothetical protein
MLALLGLLTGALSRAELGNSSLGSRPHIRSRVQAPTEEGDAPDCTDDITSALEAHWSLQSGDVEDSNTYTDLTGNGHHLDVSNAAMIVAGHMDCPNTCSGSNTYYATGATSIWTGDRWTVSAWFRTDGETAVEVVWLAKTVSNQYGLKWPTAAHANPLYHANGDLAIATTNPSPGTWYHIVVVHDKGVSNKCYIYVDGVQEDDADCSGGNGTQIQQMRWCSSGASSSAFCGDVKRARVYKRALTDAEVLCLYQQGEDY